MKHRRKKNTVGLKHVEETQEISMKNNINKNN